MKVHHGLDVLPRFKNAVLTIGSFDGVHLGHRKIIQEICDEARHRKGESVLLTFHPHPRHVLDPQDTGLELLSTLEEKIQELKKTGLDHLVVVPFTFEFSQLSKEEYLQKILIANFDPACIIIGYDHRFGQNRQGDVSFLREMSDNHGYDVREINEEKIAQLKISSTRIRKAIRAKEIIKANLLLGYSFPLTGRVINGLKIGKTIGYPTANVKIDDQTKMIPPDGIYAAKVRCNGQWKQGMLYIGNRPTIDSSDKRTIEINILDFNGELYGENLLIEIKAFIRKDAKFDDLEALKKQISDDERVIRRLFNRLDDDNRKLTKCAVVLLNYNGRHHLEKYLSSVIHNSGPEDEVVIADNASTDDSVKWISKHHPDIRLIRLSKNHGFAGGYNEALKQIKAKYYILLNSDIEPNEHYSEKLIEVLEGDADVGAVQPKVISDQNRKEFEYAGAAGGFMDLLGYPLCRGRVLETTEEDHGQYDNRREIFWASGCAMAVRANLFHKLGGFDSWYFAHQEEIDLCWRLKRAGFKIIYQPESKVFHLGGGTLDYLSTRKTYLNFKNSLANIFKNKPFYIALPLILFRLLLDGAASLYFLSKGQHEHILSVLKAHLNFYRGLPYLINKKIRYNVNISRTRCGPSRESIGTINRSIVWEYYIRGRKKFKDLGV